MTISIAEPADPTLSSGTPRSDADHVLISLLEAFKMAINDGSLGVFISFVTVTMGVFGIGEVLVSAEEHLKMKTVDVKFKNLWPTIKDILDSKWAIVRGTVVGFLVGALPGAGSTIASFISYGVEKGVAKNP